MPILSPQEAFYTNFESILKHRFQMTLEGVAPFLIKSVSIPTPTSSEIVIDHINVQFKQKGKTTFGDFSFSIYSAIAPDAMQSIYEWVRLGHEALSGRNGYQDFYKKQCQIDVLSPALEVVSRYTVYGAWVKSISGLDFDKSADGMLDVSITCACDYCIKEF